MVAKARERSLRFKQRPVPTGDLFFRDQNNVTFMTRPVIAEANDRHATQSDVAKFLARSATVTGVVDF